MRKQMTYDEFLVRVKEGIATPAGNCPVTLGLQPFRGKWADQVLYCLCVHDSARFSTMKSEIPGITSTMLTSTLRDLEAQGIVDRQQFNEIPPHVEYSLSAKGRDLMPVFYELMNWGFAYEESSQG